MSELGERSLRIAMFSPAPPVPSGIAAYLLDLLPLLPEAWEIDVFTDTDIEPDVAALSAGRSRQVYGLPHTAFAERHEVTPYDLPIYQVGNSSNRTWMIDHALKYPGLTVLHDGVVHPARVDAATRGLDMHAYRKAADDCLPDNGAALGHLVAGGLGGPSLYFGLPLCEDLVGASRVTGMHGALSCAWLTGLVPEAAIADLVHWRSVDVDPERREAWRARLAPRGEVVLGTFGNIGSERRLDRALRALATIDAPWRLLVAGSVDGRLGLAELAAELGVADRIAWEAGLDDADFVAAMAATDVAINLRYPQVRASSGVLHQLLQLGVPAVISDVVHWRDYPDAAVARIPPGPDGEEDAALAAALTTWVSDAAARSEAGRAAATWAAENLTSEGMRDSYLEAVGRALAASD